MPTLLVVEDHAGLGRLIVQFLRSGGFEVPALARSAEEALEQLAQVEVDLALIDVALPKTSGIDLIAQIREQHPTVRCLVFSGHVEPDYVQRAMKAGAWGYVAKAEPEAVLTAVNTVLDGETYISESLRKDLLS